MLFVFHFLSQLETELDLDVSSDTVSIEVNIMRVSDEMKFLSAQIIVQELQALTISCVYAQAHMRGLSINTSSLSSLQIMID